MRRCKFWDWLNKICFIAFIFLITSCSSLSVINAPTPTAPVSKAKAKLLATKISEEIPGSIIAQGRGKSMKPVMGDNTILIIKRLSFEDLKEGMIVAYRGDKSNPVVHQLILKIKDRGIVKGWNNRIVDEVMVTEDNLIGVILGMVYYDLEEEDIGQPKYLLRN